MDKQGVMLRQNITGKMSEWPQLLWRVLGVLVIGAVLAKWTWVLFAPASLSVSPALPPPSGIQTERLFGVTANAAAASPVNISVALPNVRLIGVFAGTPGFAVLELDDKRQLSVATGNEISPGNRLVEVAIDRVVIERGGVRQQILLDGKDTALKSAASALSASAVVDTAALQRMLGNRSGL